MGLLWGCFGNSSCPAFGVLEQRTLQLFVSLYSTSVTATFVCQEHLVLSCLNATLLCLPGMLVAYFRCSWCYAKIICACVLAASLEVG
jgi:hypothetical protein